MTFWLQLDKPEDVANAAADAIEEHARLAIQQRGEFKLVLAGGTTPQQCYHILANRSLDWNCWKLFYGDERCLPENDAQRNHQMVKSTGLTQKINQHFPMAAELGPDKGAELYHSIVAQYMPFDMVLLGMGEDGHTASLFPGLNWNPGMPEQLVMAVYDAPKPPPERISLSMPALQQCRQMLVMVTGDSKRDALRQWKNGVNLPVAAVSNCEHAAVYIEKGVLG